MMRRSTCVCAYVCDTDQVRGQVRTQLAISFISERVEFEIRSFYVCICD